LEKYGATEARLYWECGGATETPRPGSILIKEAASAVFGPVVDAFTKLQRPLGGPNPLTTALVGGVLGSGLGYGAGYLGEKFMGDKVEPGVLRKNLALAGGMGGAGLGAAWGGLNMAHPQQTGGGAQAWTSKWPFEAPQSPAPKALPGVLDERTLGAFPELDHIKLADDDYGSFYSPTIPVDAFNAAVWNSVAPPNPYGTRSSYGSNDVPLAAPAAAAVSGLVAGAGASTGTGYVSPYQIALAAGVAGAGGYATGALAGQVLGALAGLSPASQAALRQGGLWAGLISGVANSVFSR
jgi:hypothetical protein